MPTPTTRSPRTPREDPRPAQSRALLIDAATRLLAEGGIDAVTIDAVTRTAGVARATLYRHFGTGTELVAAAFEKLLPPVPPAPARGPLRRRLLTLLVNQAQLIDHAPLQLTVLSWVGMSTLPAQPDDLPGIDQPDTARPWMRTLRRRIVELYRRPFDTILTGDDARKVLGADIDTTAALAQLVGPVVFNRLVTGLPNDETFCARVVDDFLAANTPRT
ncbi:TetR/AcrR family transcriptional regulator [Amycolatopsis acidiphila]|uniref:TetR/AcrR family transcriptional regulator n=2 Tax=Amycolatopsis TaxID=1813 RepID=A0A558A7P2_9PSEU|nr:MULTISPECIES: TetR/AcrR family transcriptional regulator [Amycolatopsis]PKV92532.1 TetR family transcriptional regulator [Amycolatopsis niigatensis]TVT20270.1 TetR/AcrR family transcriptional regulator [Amycolatopsis acidiphila]UIJ59721.1 TetR/AcrR family transcriptional regulator [Amycolatopsis acidiphila]GHG81576.1 TetR family transcriptional regulator [Amycolatopsis acidiphila]